MTPMRRILRKIVFLTSFSCFGAATMYAFQGAQTVEGIVEKLMGHSAIQPDEAASDSKKATAATPEGCPEPAALDLFQYQIVFEKTEESGTLKRIDFVHADVWER